MSASNAERFYELLPAVYRVRDADRGEPLRALLRVIDAEFGRLEGDIAGLYDNWFIETCDEWVVPYIGDLLGVRPIRSVASAGVSLRGYVANTLAYRRRKGTAFVLAQLARDATGWPAHAVEFFQRLATTQHMNHVRPVPSTAPNIRNAVAAQLAGTAFGQFAHVPEMRRIATRGGRYGVPNVGLFLWRLQSYPIGQRHRGVDATDFGSARRLPGPNTFAFHPVAVDTPLFNVATAEDDIAHLTEEQNVPAPLRRLVLAQELAAIRKDPAAQHLRFLGAERPAFRVIVRFAGSVALTEVPREHIYMCCIPEEVEQQSPPPLVVAIDPWRGQLRFPAAFDFSEVLVSFAYGFPGDLGGGPYDRTASIHDANSAIDSAADSTRRGFLAPTWQAGVSHLAETGTAVAPVFADLRSAVTAWNALPAGQTGVIVLTDSLTDTHSSPDASPPTPLEIRLPRGSRLLITGAGWPRNELGQRQSGVFAPTGVRPHLVGDIAVHGTADPEEKNAGMLVLNGLLLEGSLEIVSGNLAQLDIQHCTLVPGLRRLQAVAGNERLKIRIERSIVGEIDVTCALQELTVVDSMIEGGTVSPAFALHTPETLCSLDSCTVIGRTQVQRLHASNCIFAGDVEVLRRQTGCVRFSFVPSGSTTPRRYRCQPELAIQDGADPAAAQARVKPLFDSLRYGAPDYGQLALRCAAEIRGGAEDGSEMGMYRFLQQPHRESNLQTVLQEYLRFGLQAGAIFVAWPDSEG